MMGILDKPKLGFHKSEQFDWDKATATEMYVHIYGCEPEWAVEEEKKPWLDCTTFFNWKSEKFEIIPGLITDPSEWVWVEKDGKMVVEFRPKTRDKWEVEENDRRRALLEIAIKRVLHKDKRRHIAEGWPTKRAKANRTKKFPRRKPVTSCFDLRKGFEIFDRKDDKTGEIFKTTKKNFRISALPNCLVDSHDIREKIKAKWPIKAVWRKALDQAWEQLRAMCLFVCEGNPEQAQTLAAEYSTRQLDWFEAVILFQGDLKRVKQLMAKQARLRIKAIRPDAQGEVGVLDFLEWELVSVGEERTSGQDILWARAEQAEKLQGFFVTTGPKKPRWMSKETWNDNKNRPSLEELGGMTFLQHLTTNFSEFCGKRNPDLYRKFSGLDLSQKSRKLKLAEKKEAETRGVELDVFLPHKVSRISRRYQGSKATKKRSKKFQKNKNER